MQIRRLTPADARVFQTLRLAALNESPSAFSSSFEEEKNFPVSLIEERLAVKADRGSFGAFEDGCLIGYVALGREGKVKLEHKALIWGLYVAPEARGKGIARALMNEALWLANSVPGIKQINLSVNANNAAAIQLYESLGFQAFGREPNAMLVMGELHDEIHMYLRAEGG
jgi:ribosomal protein S18 acetylase RimI-like enzyme